MFRIIEQDAQTFLGKFQPVLKRAWEDKAWELALVQIKNEWVTGQPGSSLLSSAQMRWDGCDAGLKDGFLKFEVSFGLSPQGSLIARPFGASPLVDVFKNMSEVEACESSYVLPYTVWALPQHLDVLAPIKTMLENGVERQIGSPKEFARMRVCGAVERQMGQDQGHKKFLALYDLVGDLSDRELGVLPGPLMVSDLLTCKRCDYVVPDGLVERLLKRLP